MGAEHLPPNKGYFLIQKKRLFWLIRVLAAVSAMAGLLYFAVMTAFLSSLWLGEGESGLDRLSEGSAIWVLSLSAVSGIAAIAAYRKILGWKAASLWLLVGLLPCSVTIVALALAPASYAPSP